MDLYIIGAGLAIGLAGLGVGIGEGLVARRSLEVMGKDVDLMGPLLVLTILGIALVESAAIYGLIVAIKITSLDPAAGIEVSKVIGAGFAVGLAGLGVGVGEGVLVGGAMKALLVDPSMKGKIMTYMVLFLALVESVAIYGLIIALKLLS